VPGRSRRLSFDYKVLSPVFRRIWRSAAAVVANSTGLARRAQAFMPDLDIRVICNGVDGGRFYPPPVRGARLPIRLVTVSRLVATKRIDVLIDAVGLLRQQGLDVHLTVAGGGRLAEPLGQIVRQRGLGDQVRLLGPVDADAMPQLYRDGDLFVSASVQEGMSNAMLEAMASGLPIVTTQCEGVDELIADNGLVVETPDARRIADAVSGIVRDRPRYEAMSAAARVRSGQFSWRRAAEAYMECYRSLVQGTACGRKDS